MEAFVLNSAVWLAWGKHGMSKQTFWGVRAQRVAFLSGNMEEAFTFKPGQKRLGGKPKDAAWSLELYHSKKQKR